MIDWKLITNGQENLLVLISAFILGGLFKKHRTFEALFIYILSKTNSKRLLLFFTSAIGGILPVEGRVTVSAPVLDTLTSSCGHSRGKMGILDFLSNHHYYLWSPIEPSVVIIIGSLGLGYAAFLGLVAPFLIAYFLFYIGCFYFYFKEEDLDVGEHSLNTCYPGVSVLEPVPFFIAILASIAYSPVIAIPAVALFYMVTLRDLDGFKSIKWKVVGAMAVVIVVANLLKSELHADTVLKTYQYLSQDGYGLAYLALIGFFLSFLLGSSSKYAGITVLLTAFAGLKFFPLYFISEYAGYLLSPTHKCLPISVMYFETSAFEAYKVLGALALVLASVGMFYQFVLH